MTFIAQQLEAARMLQASAHISVCNAEVYRAMLAAAPSAATPMQQDAPSPYGVASAFWCDKVPHGEPSCPKQCALCAEAAGVPGCSRCGSDHAPGGCPDGVPECPVCSARPGEAHHRACSEGKLAKAIAADAGLKGSDDAKR